jgi:polar amino acid transport system permease protein
LPALVPGLNLPDFAAAVVALSLNVGAYNSEAIRAGLLAVPRGQTEAARALGLGQAHVFFDVVFPQAFKISLPPLVSNFVALLKDSSLAYAIGVVELTNVGNRIQSATFQPIATLSTVAITYLLLTTLVTQISNAIEYRFDVEGRSK